MKLMIHWEIHPEKRHDVFAAWADMDLADYQTQQGPSVQVLGRWHDLVNFRGVAICETDDAEAFSRWLLDWNAVVDFEVSVVHTDEEAHAIAKQMAAQS
jgi:hypothetical protein